MKVAVISRSQERVDGAVAQIKETGAECIGFAGDVRDYDALAQAIAETRQTFGEIDTLVAGAAGNFLCPAEELSPNGFKAVIDIDLLGTFYAARAAFEHLKKPAGRSSRSPPAWARTRCPIRSTPAPPRPASTW